MAPATRSPPTPSPVSLTSSRAVRSAPNAAAYCRARVTASLTAASRARSAAGLSRAQPPDRAGDLDVVEPAERDHQLADGVEPPQGQPGVQRGHRLAGSAAVAHLEVHRHPGGLGELDGVAGGGHDRRHLVLPGAAPLERGLPVTGAHPHGDVDVGDLRVDDEERLAADDHLRSDDLGTAHAEPPGEWDRAVWRTRLRLSDGAGCRRRRG